MATLEINGRKVEVDDSFRSLSPEQQQATVEEIAAALPQATAEPQKPDYRGDGLAGTRLGAAITGAAQGVTFGLADEAKAKLWEMFGHGDYDSNLEQNRNVLDQMREEDKIATYGGELAGAMLLPGAAAKSSLTVGRNALRLGAAGAASGGEGGFGPRMQSAAVSGAVGGAVGAAAPYAVQAVTRGLDKRATRKAIDVAADAAASPAGVKAQSQAAFAAAREKGAVINSDAAMPLVNEIAEIKTLHKRFTPDANGLIDDILADLSKGKVPLEALEDLHRSAGMAVNNNRMARPQDAAAAGEIGKKIDEFLMNLPDDAIASATGDARGAVDAFREGRRLWKSFRNSERLQEVIANAEMKDNPALAIKNGFRSILSNKNKRATYSAAELQVMRQVVDDTKAGSWVQRLIGYGTGLSRQVAAVAAGSAVGGHVGAALGSMAATKLGSMAKNAASDTALASADRAARFSATGGQYALPAPAQAASFGNALRHAPMPSAVGANWLTQ
jgi:hypothetical protein